MNSATNQNGIPLVLTNGHLRYQDQSNLAMILVIGAARASGAEQSHPKIPCKAHMAPFFFSRPLVAPVSFCKEERRVRIFFPMATGGGGFPKKSHHRILFAIIFSPWPLGGFPAKTPMNRICFTIFLGLRMVGTIGIHGRPSCFLGWQIRAQVAR